MTPPPPSRGKLEETLQPNISVERKREIERERERAREREREREGGRRAHSNVKVAQKLIKRTLGVYSHVVALSGQIKIPFLRC
jgi:hypothetical protein